MKQLEPGFKIAIHWNKYQSKITMLTQNQYLDFLIDPTLQRVKWLFVFSFENENNQESYKWNFLPTVEI